MQTPASQVRYPRDPPGPRAADPQPPVASDAAAVTADALMHLREMTDPSHRNNIGNESENENATVRVTSSDQPEPPSRIVKLITATTTTTGKPSTGHGAATNGSPPDASLPPGWQRVTHDSGLPCFVNRELEIVTWSKPYVLDAIGGDFLTMATTHVPPLSLFNRGSSSSSLAARPVAQRQPVEESKVEHPQGRSNPGMKKRKAAAAELAPRSISEFETPTIIVRREEGALPLLEINGTPVPSPEGKTIHDVLKDFCAAAWSRVPQYSYSKVGGPDGPTECSVRVGRHLYGKEEKPTKALAKDAAAHFMLDHFVPGFWDEWSKVGRVENDHIQLRLDRRNLKREARPAESKQPSKHSPPALNRSEPAHRFQNDQEGEARAKNSGRASPFVEETNAQETTRHAHQLQSLERQIEHQIREVMVQGGASRDDQYLQSASKAQSPQQAPYQPQEAQQHQQHQQQIQQATLQHGQHQQHPTPTHHPQHQQQHRAASQHRQHPQQQQHHQQHQHQQKQHQPQDHPQQTLQQPAPQRHEQVVKRSAPFPRQAASPQIKQEPKAPNPQSGTMTMDEFKKLAIDDPRVLQGCLSLSIKTPAQVIQEYQNRHRGTSVNYNTLPHQIGSEKVFKTIVTAGRTAAEGIGPSKKVSRQTAAQVLLKLLHERGSTTLYYEVAELYSNRNVHNGSQEGHSAAASARPSPSKKARRSPPVSSHAVAMPYAQSGQAYSQSVAASGWDGYATYNGGSNQGWQGSPQEAGYGRKNERIVEYSGPPSGLAGGYDGYYGNGPSGSQGAAHPHAWSYNRVMVPPPPPPPQQQQYGIYGPGSYASAPPRPSDQYHPHPLAPPSQSTLPPGYSYGPPQPRGAQYNHPKGPYH